MNRDALTKLISDGMSTRKIAEHFECSQSNVRHWMRKYDLKTSLGRFNRTLHLCKDCGETSPSNFYGHTKRLCKKCVNLNDTKISIAKKLRAIEHMGGSCRHCGYDRFYGALDFHHVDIDNKEDWGNLRNWGWARIVEELKKCILLCSNCHREEHGRLRGSFD